MIRTGRFTNPLTIPLTLVFLVLKLVDYIDWSWYWILAPIWIGCLTNWVLTTLFWWRFRDKEEEG